MTGRDFWIWFVVFVASAVWFSVWVQRRWAEPDPVTRFRRTMAALDEACKP